MRSSSYDRNEEFEENCQQIAWVSADSSAELTVYQDSRLNALTNQVLDLPEGKLKFHILTFLRKFNLFGSMEDNMHLYFVLPVVLYTFPINSRNFKKVRVRFSFS